MTSTRGIGAWTAGPILGLLVVLAAATSGRAQPGYGLDPFWPYNSQYEPYTFPTGPAPPSGGGGGVDMPRAGVRGANQYQDYLDSLTGAPRSNVERYGIGVPYYRGAVTPSFRQDYEPNRRSERTYEQAQQLVEDKYLAYFSERDPKRRAALLKEYRAARRQADRLLTASPGSVRRPSAPPARPRAATGASSTSRGITNDDLRELSSRRSGSASSRPAPPPPRSIPGAARSATDARRTPTDVLNRSRSLDLPDDRTTGSSTPRRPRRPTTPRDIDPLATEP